MSAGLELLQTGVESVPFLENHPLQIRRERREF